jgi:hypothetical protein
MNHAKLFCVGMESESAEFGLIKLDPVDHSKEAMNDHRMHSEF